MSSLSVLVHQDDTAECMQSKLTDARPRTQSSNDGMSVVFLMKVSISACLYLVPVLDKQDSDCMSIVL